MLAIFAVVLALAGAPASTSVTCVTGLPGGIDGWAPLSAAGSPDRVELVANEGCLAARYAAANRRARSRLARSHQDAPMAWVVGTGLLVALHEAEHVALRSFDECVVERLALAKLPVLLRRFFPRLWRPMLGYARGYDEGLPAKYHPDAAGAC